MELTLVAKDPDSVPNGSPTLYRTDRGSWVVQGWVATCRQAFEAVWELAVPFRDYRPE